jgi:hypothetical protein
LAVGSLTVLLVLLAGGALLTLRPWEADSVKPHLGIAPQAGLDDSVAVAHSGGPSVAAAEVAGGSAVASDVPVAAVGSDLGIGISSNRAVLVAPAVPVDRAPGAPAPAPTTVAVPVPVPVPVSAPPPSRPEPVLAANFENGLEGVSKAPSDFAPMVARGPARDGSSFSVIRLEGNESRSQLILGGEGEGDSGAFQIHEGDEYALAFSFYIQTMAYGFPGAPNLIMQFQSDASEVPAFGLQLLDYPGSEGEVGGRGLWSGGEAMGGDRFLAPAAEGVWHDVVIHFRASSQGAGFYEVFLDGQPIDARSGVSLIAPGSYAQIELGLFRNGDLVQGTSEIRLDAVKLGDTLESVMP